MNRITPIKSLSDSYIWAITNEKNDAVLVDPGEAKPVLNFIKSENINPVAILITHHHYDHIDGVKDIKKEHKIPVFGPKNEDIECVDTKLKENDSIELPEFEASFTVIDAPGHTKGHIAYHYENKLFCGDTLFSGGCGRIFDGSYEQMHHSLNKIKRLSPETLIYCAHEYTLANLKFAQVVEPENENITELIEKVNTLSKSGSPSIPSKLEIELLVNPFLRCDNKAVINAANSRDGSSMNKSDTNHINSELDTFIKLRQWKDNF